MTERTGPCGSNKPRRALHDARSIFCTFVFDACEREKRAGFRSDIFTDPNWADEPIAED